MITLIVEIERNGLFGKKSNSGLHFPDPNRGEVVIHVPDANTEIEIRKCIDITNDDIKAKGISEQTFIFDRISENLRNRKINGGRVKEMTIFSH